MTSIMNSNIPALATAAVAFLTLIATAYFRYRDGRVRAQERLLDRRRDALMLALQVIDHTYSNESFDDRPPFSPHDWDPQLARDADNQMRIYCGDPRTRQCFIRALGLHNPTVSSAPGADVAALDEFRKQISRELGLPEPLSDPNIAWIAGLAGARVDVNSLPQTKEPASGQTTD